MPAQVSALGPFFEVARASGDGPWRPVRDLLEPPVLAERVGHVAGVLGRQSGVDVEDRVAASTLSLGLFARLVSPVLAAGVVGEPLPRPTLDHTWWQPVRQGPWPLALTGPDAQPSVPDLLTDVLAPLVDALADQHALSRQVLEGNITSAVFGAARMIGVARPDLAGPARHAAAALLAGPLAGTGDLGEHFVRSSCCLYYRVPGGGYCGDCVLAGSA